MLERSAKSDDSDARWIVRENLGKNRLQRLDPQRVAEAESREDAEQQRAGWVHERTHPA
jgi:hypothetical protein